MLKHLHTQLRIGVPTLLAPFQLGSRSPHREQIHNAKSATDSRLELRARTELIPLVSGACRSGDLAGPRGLNAPACIRSTDIKLTDLAEPGRA